MTRNPKSLKLAKSSYFDIPVKIYALMFNFREKGPIQNVIQLALEISITGKKGDAID